MTQLTRRDFLATAGAVPVAVAAQGSEEERPPSELTFSTPADHISALLKLSGSLGTETVYQLCDDTHEAMIPGHEIVNLVSSTTLIRRDFEAIPKGHRVKLWEVTVYHRQGETEPLEEFRNPLNDRMVRPFHRRAGRGEGVWTDKGVQIVGSDGKPAPLYDSTEAFSVNWSQAGERIWTSRYNSGSFGKNPITAENRPREFAGPDQFYSEKVTHSGLIGEIADPSVINASATYALNACTLWAPWLLMGQTPGHMVWNSCGVKLSSPDMIPTQRRRMIEAVFPTIFDPVEPWPGRIDFWSDYLSMREPVT
jgi:hypothetical protein